MNKYKVEFIRKETFIVDVLAKDEAEAQQKAGDEFEKILEAGIEHHHQIGDIEVEAGTVYDVTATEDPFSPINK